MRKLEECAQHWYQNRSRYQLAVQSWCDANGLEPRAVSLDLLVFRGMHDDAWHAGARWALMESSKLSPHIARFFDMLILLGIPEESAGPNGLTAVQRADLDACDDEYD